MRKPADRERIERFLAELGRRAKHLTRILVTGGASMILRGLRGETLDVDFSVGDQDLAIAHEIEALKDRLEINVEFADPAQFGPLPAGRESRFTYHGRYGNLDVLLDDPYAIAFSKLRRGEERDLRDVRLLADSGLIDYVALEAKASEVAAPGTVNALKVDIAAIRARLERVRRSP